MARMFHPARLVAVLAAALSLFPSAPSPRAQGIGNGAPSVLAIGANEGSLSRKIDLTIGRSLIIDLPRDAKEVFVAKPSVANAVVRSTRKVFVIGMENGATSIFVMDAEGRQIVALDVTVARDLNIGLMRQTLTQSIPGGRFEPRVVGDSIVLSGSVNSASEAIQAVDIAKAFVGISGTTTPAGGAAGMMGAAAPSVGAVINNLTVRERDQVILRVTVIEVARTVLKQFGINTTGNWGALNPLNKLSTDAAKDPGNIANNFLTNSLPFPITGGSTPAGNQFQASLQAGGFSLQATLKAFEQAGVSRILAEPTLTAVSGEAAKFLAGGEIPVPSSAACGSASICTPGIAFKPYGVSLTFTPVVLSENRISIRVGTDVTEIDTQTSFNYAVGSQTVAVPGTRVRKSETTVELPSGGVMMTAGLIQQVSRQAISGLPGLLNIPILGTLFRSRDYQRQETELMILVTPLIAKPMQPEQVSRPDDGFVGATDPQAILLGRLNRIYGVAGGRAPAAGYRGRVGFIND